MSPLPAPSLLAANSGVVSVPALPAAVPNFVQPMLAPPVQLPDSNPPKGTPFAAVPRTDVGRAFAARIAGQPRLVVRAQDRAAQPQIIADPFAARAQLDPARWIVSAPLFMMSGSANDNAGSLGGAQGASGGRGIGSAGGDGGGGDGEGFDVRDYEEFVTKLQTLMDSGESILIAQLGDGSMQRAIDDQTMNGNPYDGALFASRVAKIFYKSPLLRTYAERYDRMARERLLFAVERGFPLGRYAASAETAAGPAPELPFDPFRSPVDALARAWRGFDAQPTVDQRISYLAGYARSLDGQTDIELPIVARVARSADALMDAQGAGKRDWFNFFLPIREWVARIELERGVSRDAADIINLTAKRGWLHYGAQKSAYALADAIGAEQRYELLGMPREAEAARALAAGHRERFGITDEAILQRYENVLGDLRGMGAGALRLFGFDALLHTWEGLTGNPYDGARFEAEVSDILEGIPGGHELAVKFLDMAQSRLQFAGRYDFPVGAFAASKGWPSVRPTIQDLIKNAAPVPADFDPSQLTVEQVAAMSRDDRIQVKGNVFSYVERETIRLLNEVTRLSMNDDKRLREILDRFHALSRFTRLADGELGIAQSAEGHGVGQGMNAVELLGKLFTARNVASVHVILRPSMHLVAGAHGYYSWAGRRDAVGEFIYWLRMNSQKVEWEGGRGFKFVATNEGRGYKPEGFTDREDHYFAWPPNPDADRALNAYLEILDGTMGLRSLPDGNIEITLDFGNWGF